MVSISFIDLTCINLAVPDYRQMTMQEQKMQEGAVLRKTAFCICENKGADQLYGNCEPDQCLCFRYRDSTITLLPKFQACSHLLWLYSPVCVGPGQKTRKPVFSQRGTNETCCKKNIAYIGVSAQAKLKPACSPADPEISEA